MVDHKMPNRITLFSEPIAVDIEITIDFTFIVVQTLEDISQVPLDLIALIA